MWDRRAAGKRPAIVLASAGGHSLTRMISRRPNSVALLIFDRAPETIARTRCADTGAKLGCAAVNATIMQCARYDRAP